MAAYKKIYILLKHYPLLEARFGVCEFWGCRRMTDSSTTNDGKEDGQQNQGSFGIAEFLPSLSKLEQQLAAVNQQLSENPKFASGMQRHLNTLIKEALVSAGRGKDRFLVYDSDANKRFTDVLMEYHVLQGEHPAYLSQIDYVELFSDYVKGAFNPLMLVQKGVPAEHLPRFLTGLGLDVTLGIPNLDAVYKRALSEPINDLEGFDPSAIDLLPVSPKKRQEKPVESIEPEPEPIPIVIAESDFLPSDMLHAPSVKNLLLASLYNQLADIGLGAFTTRNGTSQGAMDQLRQHVEAALAQKGTYARLQVEISEHNSEPTYTVRTVPYLVWISQPITKNTLATVKKDAPIMMKGSEWDDSSLPSSIREILSSCQRYFGTDSPIFGKANPERAVQAVVGLLEHEIRDTNKLVRFTIYQRPSQDSPYVPSVDFKVENVQPLNLAAGQQQK